MKADLNVLDVDALQPHPLEIVYDLPAGAKRIVQHADGFVSTIVAGEVVAELGADTGARPGRVVRSAP
jgi:N-acyl-D-aspartate/D-glutamate deacylase